MPTLWNQPYTRSDLRRHVMDMRHLADIRPFELSDGPERGVRCLHVRNAAGLDLHRAIADTRALHPREAVRALADLVLDVTGQVLADDATVLCVDWYGGHGRDRSTVHGADHPRRRAG